MNDPRLPVPVTESTGLVVADLIDRAKEYARASKAASTLKTYDTCWRIFTTWCRDHDLSALPAKPETVAAFVADRAENTKPVTIKKALAAISVAHKVAGFESPTASEAVRLTMQGLRRVKGVAGNPRKALRVEHIRKMVATLPGGPVGVRDRCVVLLGFVAGMRRSEIVALDVADVASEPEGAVVTIRRSKRDQDGKGRQVAVPRGHHDATCPVRALQAWTAASGITEGPLFVRLDPGAPRDRLDGRSVALIVKRAARRAGLDPAMFSGHSLRRGFCTEAARGGAAERDIARTTGHSSMMVLRGYVEQGTLFENCAAKVLDL